MTDIAFDQKIAQIWSHYKPPFRPSREDCELYESIMKRKMKTLTLPCQSLAKPAFG